MIFKKIHFLFLLITISNFSFSQSNDTLRVKGLFYFEEIYSVWNILQFEDTVLRGPILIEYSNNCNKCYDSILYRLDVTSFQKLLPKNRIKFHELLKLTDITSDIKKIRGIPIEKLTIEYNGFKYYMVYMIMDIQFEKEIEEYIPILNPLSNEKNTKKTLKTFKIVNVIDYKIINPKDIFPE